MSEINRLDKLERDSRRFFHGPIFKKSTVIFPSIEEEKIVGKSVANMVVKGGDVLVYNKRSAEWEPEPFTHPAAVRSIDDAICHNNSVICHNNEIVYL